MNITDHVQLLLDNAALLRSLGRLGTQNYELMRSNLEAVIKEAEIIVDLINEEETKEAEMIIGLMEEPTQPKKPAA